MRPSFLAFFVVVCLGFSGLAGAGAIPPGNDTPASCDPDFYGVLWARSWLEGKREMETAQRLILKPDSVLEYSCFEDGLAFLAEAADDIFSDNVDSEALFNQPALTFASTAEGFSPPVESPTGPDPPGGLDAESLDDALEILVLEALEEYLDGNFDHTPGGGTLPGAPDGLCNLMDFVWDELKCRDFDIEDFVTFDELAGTDRRIFPEPCDEPNRAQNWADALEAVSPPPATPAEAGGMDAVVSYVEIMITNLGCQDEAIPTGVIVDPDTRRGPLEPFPDAVCPTIGCFHDGAGGCEAP